MPQFSNGGQTGGGDFGQTGTGDFGQTGTGDFGQTGTGDFGQTGTGDFGQTGTGDFGQTGTGDPGKTAQRTVTVTGPTVIAHRRLNFKIQRQEQTDWCWAAVAVSVEQYFDPDPDPATRLKQCRVASLVFQAKCCENPGEFNQGAELETALQLIHKWRNTLDEDPSTGATGSLTFEQVQREIDRSRPICAGITWNSDVGGGGHFVVIRGYRVLNTGAQQLYIADPDNPSNLVDFDEFTVAYYGEGRWTETDFVESDWA
jgi:hypothetical protein